MKVSEEIKEGLEKLGPNGEYWSPGHLSGVANYCMTTSLPLLGSDEAIDVFKRLFNSDSLDTAWQWNDAPGRTFAEVKAKMLEAIAIAEQEELEAA